MIEAALRVGILIPTRPISQQEINYFLQQEEVSSLALKRFLGGEISFTDYVDILELCDLDIDEYLDTVDDNFGLIL